MYTRSANLLNELYLQMEAIAIVFEIYSRHKRTFTLQRGKNSKISSGDMILIHCTSSLSLSFWQSLYLYRVFAQSWHKSHIQVMLLVHFTFSITASCIKFKESLLSFVPGKANIRTQGVITLNKMTEDLWFLLTAFSMKKTKVGLKSLII